MAYALTTTFAAPFIGMLADRFGRRPVILFSLAGYVLAFSGYLHYLGKGRTIRLGLHQLQNIRRETLEAVLTERSQNGPFVSLEDFLRRVELTPSDGTVLVKSGCLDSLTKAADLNRPRLLWYVESLLNVQSLSGRKMKQPRAAPTISPSLSPRRVPPLPDFSPQQRWQQEMDSFGFVLSAHPLTLFEPSVHYFPQQIIPASELARHVGRRVWVLGWPITRKEVMTRKGEPMEFVSLQGRGPAGCPHKQAEGPASLAWSGRMQR